ncbi:MAG: glutamyl-tRNA reductase [Gemmatimonadaceae bacterium]
MQLLAAGVNHTSAPLPIRERLLLAGQPLDRALSRLATRVQEGFILSTCNRTEVYALVGHADSGARALADLLAECGSVPTDHIMPFLQTRAHDAAVRHVFGVAGGILSMVTGEDQILAQLKEAIERAQTAGTLGPATHRLAHAALGVGKRVRSDTAIGRHSLSIVSVALRETVAALGSLAGRHVLVVGAGHTAELAVKHSLFAEPARCTVVNRDDGRARALARRHGVDVLTWDMLESAIVEADLVLSCTSAPGFVLERGMIERVQRARDSARLSLVDLAMPRDIDPEAGRVPGVTLTDIDHLEAICLENRQRRVAEIEHAEQIIELHVERLMGWWSARQVAPTITALVARATAIRDAEVDRALARLPNLSAREQLLVRTLGARLINKLIHRPMTVLKTHSEAANMASVLQLLFELPSDAPTRPPSSDFVTEALACPRFEAGET